MSKGIFVAVVTAFVFASIGCRRETNVEQKQPVPEIIFEHQDQPVPEADEARRIREWAKKADDASSRTKMLDEYARKRAREQEARDLEIVSKMSDDEVRQIVKIASTTASQYQNAIRMNAVHEMIATIDVETSEGLRYHAPSRGGPW